MARRIQAAASHARRVCCARQAASRLQGPGGGFVGAAGGTMIGAAGASAALAGTPVVIAVAEDGALIGAADG